MWRACYRLPLGGGPNETNIFRNLTQLESPQNNRCDEETVSYVKTDHEAGIAAPAINSALLGSSGSIAWCWWGFRYLHRPSSSFHHTECNFVMRIHRQVRGKTSKHTVCSISYISFILTIRSSWIIWSHLTVLILTGLLEGRLLLWSEEETSCKSDSTYMTYVYTLMLMIIFDDDVDVDDDSIYIYTVSIVLLMNRKRGRRSVEVASSSSTWAICGH